MIITNNYLPDKKFYAFISDGEETEMKAWPDEHGATPRDLSLGYIDIDGFERMHVYPITLFINKIKSQA